MAANLNYIKPQFLEGGSLGCLLVHGFTSSPADVRPLSKHLHSLGFTVREVLLPGHGTSPQDMARYGCKDWLLAAEDELKELKTRCSHTWVLGFSMGGIIAILTAASNEVAGLVSIAAPIWPRPYKARFAFILGFFKEYAQLGKSSRHHHPSWRYEEVALKNVADLMRLIQKGKRALKSITVPTLVVQGSEDRTIAPKSAHYIYKHLGTTKKMLHCFPGGHLLLLGGESETICRRIGQYIIETGGDADGSS